ncbi:GNAT family N-acetyltransferase [Planococcus sp. NCCP-2050]|uniref:GNAT family N-acetyltransferase n=1 Tax=Planococcus sp. NCCP-2050 TaxID=2944679 RepID=UPI0020414C0B|nr:GNAT family N-acetyltransferase [Planococcus sp. NCCP-2050]GKW45935.1 N-acetyltransferase [Planococcus sp. NCCP-2050]
MKIETGRLEILPCRREHLQMLEEQYYENGPEIIVYLKALEEDPELLAWGHWLIIDKMTGQVIGDAGFKGKPNADQEIEIGYGLLERYWNKGYATETVKGLIAWAFETGKVEKVRAETEKDNIGSIRVLEKAGMHKTMKTDKMISWEIKKSSAV